MSAVRHREAPRPGIEHLGLVPNDGHAATISTLAFVPAIHLNHPEAVLPMQDGLLKLRDFPAAGAGPARRRPNSSRRRRGGSGP